MSDANFTQGPWCVEQRAKQWAVVRKMASIDITIAIGAPIRSLRREEMISTGEESANARLIAAAPDLYAVVREYVSWCDRNGVTAPPSHRARAALTKAHK